jgi:hypothetical protein
MIVAGCVLVVSCDERAPDARSRASASCEAPEVRQIVERFGERLQRVSLLAPDSVVVREMRDAYAPFVTPELLDRWTENPRRAPGRELSSPWPARIEVRTISAAEGDGCRVEGDVVYVTSASAATDSTLRQAITLVVRDTDGWRIAAYAPTSQPSAARDTSAPEAVLRQYYAAINAGDYRQAYTMWANAGEASNQTYEQFAAGFADTRSVQLAIGTPGRVEGAAGSRYVEIPVTVNAMTNSGERQQFEGVYVLRRSVVDGASSEQRRWHLYRATLRTAS